MPDETGIQYRKTPHSFWSGTVAFGLVSIPVDLYLANRAGGIPLRIVDEDGTPLHRKYFCSKDSRPLETDDIVRGYEVEKDRYVTVSDKELEALAPEKSREIDLKRFVPLDQIDPIYFEHAYILAPENREANKAYRLLAHVMETERRAGIATFVMHGKEYLIAIIAQQGLLRAETLRFHDELRSPQDVGLPALKTTDKVRVRVIEKEIKALMVSQLERNDLTDLQRHRLHALVGRKLKSGIDVIAAPEESEEEDGQEYGGAEVIDLMEVLKKRLGQKSVRSSRKPDNTSARHTTFTERPKAELYQRAKQLGITGRSRMTRAQLIQAIRKAR